ncbi:MAG: 4-(cytidine 5'-diphospho)-2-C-methyl-D-erythritol kinase [Bacteroidales bacterium]
MIDFPNCKINLGLNVTSRRSDGFHDIETQFFPVPFHDAVEIIPAPDGVFQFRTSGIEIPGEPEENLIVRAFRLLQADYHLPEVRMHLHKVVPAGSGLGGGSSDAAYTLKIVNQVFTLGIDNSTLLDYARRLGSDCAFFIGNKPALAFGKGDQFEPFGPDLQGLYLVIVIPGVHVSTADAYSMVVPAVHTPSIREVIQLPVDVWKDLLVNDFEKPVFAKFPVIGHIKQELYDAGAVYASMSGSGSALYGLFADRPVTGQFNRYFVWETYLGAIR